MKGLTKQQKRRLLLLALLAVIVVAILVLPGRGSTADPAVPTAALNILPPADEHADPPAAGTAETPPDAPEESLPVYEGDYSYTDGSGEALDEYGTYSGTEDVAYYLHVYGHLPDNFLTKDEAEDMGWISAEGNLWDVAYGMSIGGDRFGNREGLLPDGETYYECDVNYTGGYRSGERIVYSDDGDIYYTADHYQSFVKLY